MESKFVDLRPALASLGTHSVRDVRVRKCPETGKILLRFKVYGPFAPAVFDECRVRLVLTQQADSTEIQIPGVIRVVQSQMARSLVYHYEFQADDPLQINALHFSDGLVQWSNVLGVYFDLDGVAYHQSNPFCRTD